MALHDTNMTSFNGVLKTFDLASQSDLKHSN